MLRVLLVFILSLNCFSKSPLSSSQLTKLSGEGVSPVDYKSVWDKRYNKKHYIYGKLPARFLAENFDYLPKASKVLDMGMGEGRNAVFLAGKGHLVTGIDISSVAIKKAKLLAKEKKVKIKTVVGALDKYLIKPGSFDVIICFYFVSRDLNQKMISWLKPGGLLIYEAHTLLEYEKLSKVKENKNYYLKRGELLKMFPKMEILKYEEPLHELEYRASVILKKKEV